MKRFAMFLFWFTPSYTFVLLLSLLGATLLGARPCSAQAWHRATDADCQKIDNGTHMGTHVHKANVDGDSAGIQSCGFVNAAGDDMQPLFFIVTAKGTTCRVVPAQYAEFLAGEPLSPRGLARSCDSGKIPPIVTARAAK